MEPDSDGLMLLLLRNPRRLQAMGDQQQEKHHHRYWYMGLASYQRCILAPVLLVYYAVAIYLLPCLVIYTLRAMEVSSSDLNTVVTRLLHIRTYLSLIFMPLCCTWVCSDGRRQCLWRPLGKCLDVLFCGLLCPYQFQDREYCHHRQRQTHGR